MSSIFTEQWATEQRLRQEQCERDFTRLGNLQKAKHTILVYTWVPDHVEPMVVEFLEGFTWSQFVLDDAVISLAGLVPLPPLYRPSLGIWTVVSLGHVVKVTENSRVFVKSIEVQHCKDLADHTIALTSQFRGRLDVTRERVEKFNLVYIWSRVLTNSLLTRTILLTVILFVLASTSTE